MFDGIVGLNESLYAYLLRISLRESKILKRLREETSPLESAHMQIPPDQGQFLGFLVKLIGAKRAIEVGVYTGYSSLSIALALPENGQLIACDINEKWTAVAKRYWEEAEIDHKVNLVLAPAKVTLQNLIQEGHDNSLDFAFIDADKEHYDDYYEACLKLIRPGGLIVLDNVFWGGDVADESVQDEETEAIRAINKKLHLDSRVDITLVPIGDGMILARKR